jgi:hypothetical protein
MGIGPAVLHKDDRIDVLQAEFLDVPAPVSGLERSEPEDALPVESDDEVDGAVAKVAHAVEKNDRVHGPIIDETGRFVSANRAVIFFPRRETLSAQRP